MTVSMGVLSCLSTGWWGQVCLMSLLPFAFLTQVLFQLSDRYGRMPIIRVAACGLLIALIHFINSPSLPVLTSVLSAT